MHHRSDVEGLRAVAVILVMLYHYQFPGISGGFIGVDVFFVISGFVITGLLARALTEGSFRFRDFYARRIKRLVPVFLLVSTVSFLMISPYYLDEDYYIFAKSWLASLIGLSNLYYFKELSQYFSPEAQSLTLLHTWSLAVEEQFYLLWPAVLWLGWRIRHAGLATTVLGLTLVGGVVLSQWMAVHHATAAYYLLPARVFELLLGASVALGSARLPPLPQLTANIMALTGMSLIMGTAFLIDRHDTFPGLHALWPTLGTALVILAGSRQTLAGRLLSLRPMVWLGGLSYSIYLWHWPPAALLHYQLVPMDWPMRIGLVIAVVALSWLSHRWVEQRFRYRPWGLGRSFVLCIMLPAIVIWAVQATIRIADDISFRIPAEKRALYKIIAQNNAGDLYKPCFKGHPVEFDRSSRCLLGDAPTAGSAPNSVLIGDSHATALVGFLETLVLGTPHRVLMITRASTPFVAPQHADSALADDPDKRDRNAAIVNYLAQGPMTVFVANWWDSYFATPAFHRYFIDTLGWLVDQGHRVVVIEDVPQLPSASYAYCLLKHRPDCSIDAAPVREANRGFQRFKREAMQRFPSVQWIDPRPVVCNTDRCQTALDGLPLYRDENHLNNVGSKEIGKRFLAQFGNPLKPSDAGLPTSSPIPMSQ